MKLTRRHFMRACGGAAAITLSQGTGCTSARKIPLVGPGEQETGPDPRQARLAWFMNAKFGLFLHYGLYSLLERGEWVMYWDKIPVAEYARLKGRFTAGGFDADRITDLAVEAGMKYVNITTRHHDGFCLFRTAATDFNSLNSPARRDLIGELANACRRKGLGLFLYYSYAMDWRHPYFFPYSDESENCSLARPAYARPEPAYRFRDNADFREYIDFAHHQIAELLTQYGPIAGIWFDPLRTYYCRPELFPVEETYSLVRSLQPGCLISFKQGANGDEDFVAPERKVDALHRGGELATKVWARNQGKPIEICDTLQRREWGYDRASDGDHKSADEVMDMLSYASSRNANLLLNSGPLPDGSIPPEDVATLSAVGGRLRGRQASSHASTGV
ncbi:MAG TPA: alpha-L-fucosidase [Phycisphaerae bacterium]|nr:alpha-L-fucosidase [Phycisphaerae bacterium]